MSRRPVPAPTRVPMTFDELCQTFNVTPTERERLAWHLGTLRMRATYEKLRGPPMPPLDPQTVK